MWNGDGRLRKGGGFGIVGWDRFRITYLGIRLISFGMRWYESGMSLKLQAKANQTRDIWVSIYHSYTEIQATFALSDTDK